MTDRLLVSVARIPSPRLIGLAFVLAAGLAAFAGASLVAAQRSGPEAPDSYQGCVNTYTDVLRIVAEGQACQEHETAIGLGASGEDAALRETIEMLEADIASQQTAIDDLQQANTDLQSEIDALEADNADQQTLNDDLIQAVTDLIGQVDDLSDAHDTLQAQVPACLSTSGNEVYFSGCNVNIRSGSGATDGTVNGLGNLIVGYNELTGGQSRTGSHNVVIGEEHAYTSYGGLVVGKSNTITGIYSTVSGGTFNVASGEYSSVSAGLGNVASGTYSAVAGNSAHVADDPFELLP